MKRQWKNLGKNWRKMKKKKSDWHQKIRKAAWMKCHPGISLMEHEKDLVDSNIATYVEAANAGALKVLNDKRFRDIMRFVFKCTGRDGFEEANKAFKKWIKFEEEIRGFKFVKPDEKRKFKAGLRLSKQPRPLEDDDPRDWIPDIERGGSDY